MSKAAGWAAALGLFLGGGAALGGASGGETYPVWWAPELGLENLDEIDAALARRFPEGKRAVFHKFGRHMVGEGETAYLGEWGSLDAQPIDNCVAYLKWTDEGYQFENTDEDSYWVYEIKGAYILSLTGRFAGCRGPRLSCNAVAEEWFFRSWAVVLRSYRLTRAQDCRLSS